jgi:hypothetical protein
MPSRSTATKAKPARKPAVPNKHRVGVRKWRRWSEVGQRVFNDTYSFMRRNQDLFLHPDTAKTPARRWDTTAWNAAWIAADHATDAQRR